MPWFMPHWSESIKKRLCRYLLQRYLGQFLEEKLTLDQLTIDLYNGKGIVSDVSLDSQALNELAEQQCMPVYFVCGSVATVSVSIPWSSLLSDSSYVEVSGLRITVRPKHRAENCASMLESMWNSLSSSMQLAEECLKQEVPDADSGASLEGLELFAQTIDSILSRVKVRFTDVVIRLEYIPQTSHTGVALELKIKNMTYLDEAGLDSQEPETDSGQYQVLAFTTKKFSLEGVSLYTDEFTLPPSSLFTSATAMTHSELQQAESDSEEDEEEKVVHCRILAAQIAGRQEVRLKMKQSENIQGPKVALEVLLGSLTFFLSPRQLQGILALADGLASPKSDDQGLCGRQKPMEARDFQLVEQDLQQRLLPTGFDLPNPQRLHPNQGWSAGGDSEEEEEVEQFLPLRGRGTSTGGMTSSMASSIGGNSMASSMTGSTVSSVSSFAHKCLAAGMPSSERTRKKKSSHRLAEEEAWSADTTTFNVRASSLAIILLQEDILVVGTIPGPPPSRQLTFASTQQMSEVSTTFFTNLGDLRTEGFGVKDFDRAREIYRKACGKSHLRLLAAPVVVEGTERTGSGITSCTEGSVIAARVEFTELLPDQPGQDCELLHFTGPPPGAPLSMIPDLQLSFSHAEKPVRRSSHATALTQPRTQLSFRLQPCLVEVDITMMDRIASLVNPPPLWPVAPRSSPGPALSGKDLWRDAINSPATTESRVDLELRCPLLTIKLRFPCPDLRPLSDMSRTPYWIRSVRPDWLLMELEDAKLETSIDSRNPSTSIELTAKDLNIFFQEADQEEARVSILHAQAEEAGASLPGGGAGFGLLRAVLTVNPVIAPADLSDPCMETGDDSEDYGHSSLDVLERLQDRSREPSPFSAKRVVHESDTPHEMQGETDELVIPGDKREMSEFIEYASFRSRVHLDLTLPHGELTIPSKHLYELIYNRLSTDLLLWEPGRPKDEPSSSGDATAAALASLHLGEVNLGSAAFAMCKSGIHMDSDSDSSSESEGIFYSVHEHRQKNRLQQAKRPRLPSGQSYVTVSLKVKHAAISLSAPVRDSSGSVIPSQRGALKLHVVDGSLFCVSSHRGDPNLGYVCVQANQAALHHLGLVPAGVDEPFLLPTIIQTSGGASVRTGGEPVGTGAHCSLNMLSVAIRIHLDEPAALKMIRVAAGIRGGTLVHRVTPGPQSWLSQLIEVLDVLDFPVAGYTPPRVITELHLHLWDCAVEYRPLYLPVRALVTLGSFSISSNIAAATRSSSIRFIAEEGALFLSTRQHQSHVVDLRRDYVCVLELGLFELALRLSEDPRAPKIDLRASSTALHLRTCADSCRALAELLTYFASDGDLQQPSTPHSSAASSHQGSLDQLQTGNQPLIPSNAELVPDMMEEAMRDAGNGHHTVVRSQGEEACSSIPDLSAEEFCFPGDNQGAAASPTKGGSDDDEEFCILGEDPGTGIMPMSGEPEVRRLMTGPVRLVENHFSVPLGRSDPLQAPRHFPNPEFRYTLCDLSLVWHLYGGLDFAPAEPKKHVRIGTTDSEDRESQSSPRPSVSHQSSISFSKSNPHEVRFGSAQNSPARRPSNTTNVTQQLTWQARGGPGRDHTTLMELQLNKVRFRHEMYPENASVASRQVLLIQSVEIRDRLATSAINKFLYLHCSEAQPRQAHANMVVIKAVHMRPDPNLPAQQECCLRLSLLPLRLNVDQDALLFLYTFFTELGAATAQSDDEDGAKMTPTHQPPVMSVKGVPTDSAPASPAKLSMDSQESDTLLPTLQTDDDTKSTPPIFFRTLLFSPDVPVRVDYQGKRVDMSHGPLAGILMGLAQLNCSELRLKRLAYRHGLLGFDKLLAYIIGEWVSDIKKNQLPSVLGGVGPMHSFVQLFQGVRDLVLLPIEQYQRDGRIVRGLQRGAHSFTSSTAMAALELTNRLVHAVQITAETAFDMLSPGPSVRQRRLLGSGGASRRRRHRYNQPADIREGVTNAYHLVQEGLGETARNIVAVASAEHEEKGVYGAVGGVLRQIPPTVVTPILLGAEAASSVLGGVRSQLAPDVRREAAQKWRTDH